MANRYIKANQRIDQNEDYIANLQMKYLNSNIHINNFLSIETVNSQFFITGKSNLISQKYESDAVINDYFNYLKQEYINKQGRVAAIERLEASMTQQEQTFTTIVHKIWERGYKDFGLVGRMRHHAHQLETLSLVDKALLLNLRRREKDFIIRHEQQYVQCFDSIMSRVRTELSERGTKMANTNNSLELLLKYNYCFHRLVELDNEIGLYNNTGLKAKLDEHQLLIQKQLVQLKKLVEEDGQAANAQLRLLFLISTLVLFVICLSISALLSRKITKPLAQLADHLQKMRQTSITTTPQLEVKNYASEIATLYRTYNHLLSQLQSHEQERNILIKRLLADEEKYRTMAERLPQSIFETNINGHFKYTNSHWLKTFGYQSCELDSQVTLDKLIIKKRSSQEKGRSNEVVAKRKDGSWFPALLYTDEIVSDGAIKGVRGVIIDISDRYRYLKLLKQERKKALAADRLKSAFLANVSHEVRTPLNAVLGYGQLLISQSRKYAEDYNFAGQIIANGTRLLNLFDDIMDFSLVKSGQYQQNKEKIDVKELINDLQAVVSNVSTYYNRTQLSVNYRNLSQPTRIISDKRTIQTIFRHLIDNAFKFTERGQIDIGAYETECELVFFVKDSGRGIADEEQTHLFEPFRQVDQELNRAYQGIGMGLALCRALVATVNGQLWLVSATNKGSTFYFSIPKQGCCTADETSHSTPLAIIGNNF